MLTLKPEQICTGLENPEVDSVQFFTDAATGRSGISQSGLAILCGVSQPAISKLVKQLITGEPPKELESLAHKASSLITKTNSKMVLYSDELCIAIIRYYDCTWSQI